MYGGFNSWYPDLSTGLLTRKQFTYLLVKEFEFRLQDLLFLYTARWFSVYRGGPRKYTRVTTLVSGSLGDAPSFRLWTDRGPQVLYLSPLPPPPSSQTRSRSVTLNPRFCTVNSGSVPSQTVPLTNLTLLFRPLSPTDESPRGGRFLVVSSN